MLVSPDGMYRTKTTITLTQCSTCWDTYDCIWNVLNFQGVLFQEIVHVLIYVFHQLIHVTNSLNLCPSRRQRWSPQLAPRSYRLRRSHRFSCWEAQNTPCDFVSGGWHICPSSVQHLLLYRFVKCQYKTIRLQKKTFLFDFKGRYQTLTFISWSVSTVKGFHCSCPGNIPGCWYLTG